MTQDTNEAGLENDPSIKYGKFLAHPAPGEEIAISGMSGSFPLASNIDEFKHNIYNKVDMISRIPQTHPEMPGGLGKIKDLSKFDTGFFGVSKREGRTMSPMCRLLLEKCVECILDAGLNPSDLEGTKTGVYTGICFSESESHWFLEDHVKGGNVIIGNSKSFFANKISHFLKLNAPSFNADTACSSSLYALENAYIAIRKGDIEQALVCGTNLLMAAGSTLQFARLGVLSKEGILRSFDEDGTGYVRAEAISAILVQKAKNCKRIYATIVHMKTNCDGYKEEGITYPSGAAQLSLLKEIYLESGVNPKDVSFIEAHGTGTPVGDPEELNSMDEFFAKGRGKPLLVGSVKSSIGHSEAVAGICSVVKAILAFETGLISPNLNFKTPRRTIPGIREGRMKVVVEATPFQDQNGLIGVSSFGFGGGNCHVLLKWHNKKKLCNGKPSNDSPRIVCVSGRTEEAVNCLLADVAEKFDSEYIGLIHNVFRIPIKNHLFRGYTIFDAQGVIKQSVKRFKPNQGNLHIYFGGVTKSSGSLAREILELGVFYNFKNRIETFLIKKHLNLNTILSNSLTSNLTQLLSELITQLCLAELVKQLEVSVQGAYADTFGELTCGYFENSLTLEEVLECVYAVGIVVKDIEKAKIERFVDLGQFIEYRSEILKNFENILKFPKNYNGFNGTEVKTTTPEFFVNAIFQNTPNDYAHIPKNSVILEVGQSLSEFRKRPLIVKNLDGSGGFQHVLDTLGSLYQYGLHPQLQKLYPRVQFPVSRATPMISSKIKWKHDHEYFVPNFELMKLKGDARRCVINLAEEQWADLDGHIIDGRNLFPATGYLFLVWSVMSEMLTIDLNKLKIVFENCKFVRACTLPNKSTSAALELVVMIQATSGKFEVSEGDVTVVTGRVKLADDIPKIDLVWQSDNSLPNELMNSRDIYKELRLRGYNYKGLFKSLTDYNKSTKMAKIQWKQHWIAFMDNMLQLKILGEDTRLLYVPISIAKLTIDPNAHLETVESLKSEADSDIVVLPIQYNPDTSVTRSGGIEICGLLASSIPRKKTTALPVLEKYQYVPNEAKLTLEQSVRVCMQVALENNCGLKINVAELIDGASNSNADCLGPIIQDVLEDQPLVTSDITVISSKNSDSGAKVDKQKLESDSEYTVVVGSALLSRKEVLERAVQATVDSGYIISREPLLSNASPTSLSNLITLNILETDEEKLVFLKKNPTSTKLKHFINVSTKTRTFDWLEKLKDAVIKDCDVIAWCQNEPLSGILGLVNCVRREPGCQNVRSLFIVDEAPNFEPSNPFYKNQLDKNMGVNVYLNNCWGTFRHLSLGNLPVVENEHCYANSTIRGDLSSIKWIEGPLSNSTQLDVNESLINVYYSSLNFRDVMTASGRINVDVITRDRREQECVQGFEFSGLTKSGQRVMGMVPQGALATLVKADNDLLWEVPNNWSLQDAATVPVVYGTCLFAIVVVGRIKSSDSILIHSGTGGIGQAAINLCLDMGCTVFTTVGTDEKRKFILKTFPQVNERYIGNSRDLSFEQMVMKETHGRGVDLVLNSLAEEKLFASARCLAEHGKFLEIGKFDLANDNQLNLLHFRNDTSYHGVMLDKMFYGSSDVKKELKNLLQKYIESGAVKPLMSNVFEINEVEQAFRFMATGKHMGKVLVKIRSEDHLHQKLTFKGLPRYFCNPDKTYIVCGGLGGFGLELADWLVLRGAKNLVLTSRRGITTAYQSYRISIWNNYGCNIKIATQDMTSKSGCTELIREAHNLAPVDAIFNLAVVLEDAILENQTQKSFKLSFGPKAYATENLDEVSRQLCPELRDFVVFSSVSCGRGNAGQSNYGMSNSVMERICEKRRQKGYPALAIQWGAIGDVGLVAEMQEDHMELEIGGTLQQSISSCLQVMDVLLRQSEASIVSSMLVAEKREKSMSGTIEEMIGAILGIRDIKQVSMQSTLAELGMDSMIATEVKQTLEREYSIFLSPTEMRNITLARIKELQEESSTEDTNIIQEQDNNFDFVDGFLKYLVSEARDSVLIKLKTRCDNNTGKTLPKIIVLPGIEGNCHIVQNLTQNLNVEAYGVNYCDSTQTETIPEMADTILPHIKALFQPSECLHLFAHSVGALVALELVSRLENLGYLVTVTLLDGSPLYIKKLTAETISINGDLSTSNMENLTLAVSLKSQFNSVAMADIMNEICKCSSLKEKLAIYATKLNINDNSLVELVHDSVVATIKRYKAVLSYIPSFKKLNCEVRLYKPTMPSINIDSKDYDLGQYFEQPVEVKIFEGTHNSFLENKDMAETIMENLAVIN